MSEPQPPPGIATDDDESLAALLRSAGPRPALPVDDLDVLRTVVAEAWQARWRARRRRRTSIVLAAALAASLLLALGLLRWRAADASPPPAAPARIATVAAVVGAPMIEEPGGDLVAARTGLALRAGARVRTSGGGRLALRLASGALLRVDVGSELGLPGSRSCELERGALYADTTGAGRGALEVRTPLGTARDVGTQFAVRLVGDGAEALHVQVRGGAVAVEREQRQEVARAGEELTVHRDGSLERRATPVYGPEWDWVLRAGSRFDVRGRSLLEFLDWVARETGWQVRFADPELAAAARGIAIGGSIGDLPADRAAFAVLAAAGLEGELRDGTLVVRRAASPAP